MTMNRPLLIWSLTVIGGALILSTLDGVGLSLTSFLAYGSMLLGSLVVGAVLWNKVVLLDKPRWLLVAILMAFALRVLVGLGLQLGLPEFGYQDSKAQQSGYVFFDAYKRDTDSLSRARSEHPLLSAFTDRKVTDQYGGLLFISAAIYRYISPDVHRPMLIVTLVAAVSAYAVLFTWAFFKRTWGQPGSQLASWIMVLYPEAVMLGASQMREPFLITSFAGSLYGYSLLRAQDSRTGVLTLFLSVGLLALPISPPFAIAILALLGITWILDDQRVRISWRMALGVVVIVGVVALALTIRSWQGIESIEGSAWEAISDWWRDLGADWRVNLVSEQSLWLDNVLDWLPSWGEVPFLVVYGLLQPFLPASIVATGAPLWRAIAIWRSLGWYLLLPFIIYAPFQAVRKNGWRSFETILSFAIWITALVASYRALGSQWDNPRYRAVFLSAQAAIGAWVWMTTRANRSPWIKRIYVLIAGATILVLQWYLGRYYGTPRLGLGMTLIAVAGFLVICLSVFLALDSRSKKLNSRSKREA